MWECVYNPKSPDFPRAPGVYVIYDGDDLLYVGSTCNLRSRLHQHIHQGIFDFDIVKFSASRRVGEWAYRELRLLNRLRPPKNRVFSGTAICPREIAAGVSLAGSRNKKSNTARMIHATPVALIPNV